MQMKRLLIFIYLIFESLFIFSQNLVLNPSFEDYWYLPQFYSKKDTFFCKNWYSYDNIASDYYNKASKDTLFSVPHNESGYHPARTGDAYVGIIPLNWGGYMEYVTGTLSESLIGGRTYKVSFYVQCSGKTSYFYLACLGTLLSKTQNIYRCKASPFYNDLITYTDNAKKNNATKIKAQIKNCDTCFITSDSSWTQISGQYKAQGGEKYITIGVFYEEKYDMKIYEPLRNVGVSEKKKKKIFTKYQEIFKLNPNFVQSKVSDLFKECPYYFIDDVSVEEVKDK